MRSTIILLAAVALGAAPAAAQNTAVDPNMVAVNNEVAADPNMAAPAPVNDLTAAPEMEPAPPVEQEGAARRNRDGGFPWGLIGLIGLVGLLGRARS